MYLVLLDGRASGVIIQIPLVFLQVLHDGSVVAEVQRTVVVDHGVEVVMEVKAQVFQEKLRLVGVLHKGGQVQVVEGELY